MQHGTLGYGKVAIRNDYKWVGPPRQGEITIYIDGRCCGRVPLGAVKEIALYPGAHDLCVRLWWYLSPEISVNVDSAELVWFRADIPRMGFFRILKALWDPFHSLILEETYRGSFLTTPPDE